VCAAHGTAHASAAWRCAQGLAATLAARARRIGEDDGRAEVAAPAGRAAEPPGAQLLVVPAGAADGQDAGSAWLWGASDSARPVVVVPRRAGGRLAA
jgi:hypothetical protein